MGCHTRPARNSSRRGDALAVFVLASSAAFAQPTLEVRSGFIECGSAHVRARAECHAGNDYCTTETLSFSNRGGRAIVPLHEHGSRNDLAPSKPRTLDYNGASWACVPGKSGGSYLLVLLRTARGGNCKLCEYMRLYDVRGRLLATDLAFDGQGRAREHSAGEKLIADTLTNERAHLSPMYSHGPPRHGLR